MNTVVTSKEAILAASRELIRSRGWPAVSIRSVAGACGVSVGSIYNYFDSKADLVSATVESVWCDIFRLPEQGEVFRDTLACVSWIYQRMEYGCQQYPGFFTLHSVGFLGMEKSNGRQRMKQTWRHILEGLCTVLKRDAKVRPDTFDRKFTAEKFADILFSLFLSAILRGDYNPDPVLELIRRAVY